MVMMLFRCNQRADRVVNVAATVNHIGERRGSHRAGCGQHFDCITTFTHAVILTLRVPTNPGNVPHFAPMGGSTAH
jgi:hypothetical protein